MFRYLAILGLLAIRAVTAEPVTWKQALEQDHEWYGSADAVRIADNLLVYQHENGGWRKNIDMAVRLEPDVIAALQREKSETGTTIDNGATYTQMRFLALVYRAGKQERFKESFIHGLEYLLDAQYANGGWPQFYPLRRGYWDHITYNDDAMTGVLEMLRDVVQDPEYSFVGEGLKKRAAKAMAKGVECILKTQVVVNDKLTVWCAQHDEKTLEPAPARKYELVSLSGSESVGVVRFLMGIDRPPVEVVRAVESAVAWFKQVKITGIRQVEKPAPGTPKGYDKAIETDAAAPPLWARFYEIGTNRPIFCGRDGVKKYSLAEIEYERRNGYRWYVDRPAKLIDHDYPKWAAKWARVNP